MKLYSTVFAVLMLSSSTAFSGAVTLSGQALTNISATEIVSTSPAVRIFNPNNFNVTVTVSALEFGSETPVSSSIGEPAGVIQTWDTAINHPETVTIPANSQWVADVGNTFPAATPGACPFAATGSVTSVCTELVSHISWEDQQIRGNGSVRSVTPLQIFTSVIRITQDQVTGDTVQEVMSWSKVN